MATLNIIFLLSTPLGPAIIGSFFSENSISPPTMTFTFFFDVISDTNQDFKRAMGVVGIPHTIVTYKSEIIHRRIGYTPGEEEDLFDVISNHKK